MSNVSRYENAELALAAYANLDIGLTAQENNKDNLIDVGMSEKQADVFALRYPEIITQHNDTATGFSATVFRSSTGALVLAIRGTDDLLGGDLGADFDIFWHGAGYDQIVAMVNWWRRLTAEPGEPVLQFHAIGDFVFTDGFEDAFSVEEGNLHAELSANLDLKIPVTGHSLGAHLALAFKTLFPAIAGEAVGFNTPGFLNSVANQNFFAALGGAVPTLANDFQMINIFADQTGTGELALPFLGVAGLHFRSNANGIHLTKSPYTLRRYS